ncbi:hypothetical protein RHGRI_037000 [Rhododendron griersonianum]|uniref:Uncharacterized protein n=1 Tax=Rhododendron griersonianum TaxID=479676 RepID=A0AAV6HUF2_9ERIC|nr:hypothetical protein RHGRI_037000 [Rhododendron griersonianum]
MAIDHGGIFSSRMTPSTSISPHTAASLVLVFVLLLLVRTTSAARYHRSNTPGTSSIDIEESTKRDMTLFSTQIPQNPTTNGIKVHQSPPLPTWRGGRVFSASAHEVPSGPNPISNR